jgi:hypothetical protein
MDGGATTQSKGSRRHRGRGMLRRWRGCPHGGAPEAASAGPRGVGGGPPSLRPHPQLESVGVASAAATLPSPRVACETCVAWGIERRTTRVARGPRTTCGVRACGAGGGGKRGRRRLTDEKGVVTIAVVAVEGVPRRRAVTSGADVEHNVLPMVFLRCSTPPPVRDLTDSRTYHLVDVARHRGLVAGSTPARRERRGEAIGCGGEGGTGADRRGKGRERRGRGLAGEEGSPLPLVPRTRMRDTARGGAGDEGGIQKLHACGAGRAGLAMWVRG